MYLDFWSKRGECPDKRPARNNKANKRKPEKQIVSGHAGFWLRQVRADQLPDGPADALAKRMHPRLVIERPEIAISRHGLPGADEAVAFIGTTLRRVERGAGLALKKPSLYQTPTLR